eukprot:5529162-Amphidinium_carterae.1
MEGSPCGFHQPPSPWGPTHPPRHCFSNMWLPNTVCHRLRLCHSSDETFSVSQTWQCLRRTSRFGGCMRCVEGLDEATLRSHSQCACSP